MELVYAAAASPLIWIMGTVLLLGFRAVAVAVRSR